MKKIKAQVRMEDKTGLILRFKMSYNGLKMLLTTAARIITDTKGQKSRPRRKSETRKSARKNHKIILLEVLPCIAAPIQYKNFMSLSMDVARVSTRPDNNVMGETSNILLHFVYDLLRLKSIRYFCRFIQTGMSRRLSGKIPCEI